LLVVSLPVEVERGNAYDANEFAAVLLAPAAIEIVNEGCSRRVHTLSQGVSEKTLSDVTRR